MKSVVRTSTKPEKKYPDTGFRLARAIPKAGGAASAQPATQKQP
jgi:hypothetical protein